MRFTNYLIICTLGIWLLGSCQAASYRKVRVVKPKKHFGYFDASKDRKKKRVKTVKYKTLKHTNAFKEETK